MKIGIVCYPTFGGSGVVATELGIGLAGLGHEVHFITYKRPVRLTSFYHNIFFHEVTSLEYPLFEYAPYESSLASKLVDVIRFEKLDILHVHYAIPHASVAYMAKQILKEKGIQIPVITTLHGTDITLVGADKSFSPVVEFSINQSDGVTAVSEHLKEETLQNFDIVKEIKVIPNFIDFTRFRKTNKDHFRKALAPEGEKILIHISNFRKVKRVEDVVRVFQIVHQKIPSKLLLIGDGPERSHLEELCRELNLCDEVRFLGKQEAVDELLAISDLFLLTSENESFGLAALEAMACEVPVISTNAGGIPEVNIHGQTGYLCNVGDIESMSAYCIELLSNENTLETFRKNAYQNALKYDIKTLLPEYVRFYEHIIDKVIKS
ncbi:MAG: N-acetyl-alpha-D-glucosaminyl L-malate synthase BshA [Saprospiraceae bacterium]|nr:N-acetyl-alpha-D-glucosaminyl L-malate synthase BshA [Saprospiraceae bacterium]MBK6564554.1 N-acetyl-alpha-D-glucosaminyl L-malate synthase BshA [Saprospiraceae bacterium]MBK7523190.1 N-acetyl-alpha-D-glucosaminyl L-malate synthase BshA [Saprospiraceae bacterium]MBK8079289.1 N-acetyl-alpha-D-glucosaminyl L-malate synthase BshA [Saprospiraceae bacterium]MBK8371815.1 N-acetyl-alpha-D-glucosaminyl L-malate synthase BshA [Saprospiraceae bacterium]